MALIKLGHIKGDTGPAAQWDVITVTIATGDWSNNTATKSVTGITTTDDLIIGPDASSMEDVIAGQVYCSAQGTGTLTFVCSNTPSSSIVFKVVKLG